jgi:hypothetical protein
MNTGGFHNAAVSIRIVVAEDKTKALMIMMMTMVAIMMKTKVARHHDTGDTRAMTKILMKMTINRIIAADNIAVVNLHAMKMMMITTNMEEANMDREEMPIGRNAVKAGREEERKDLVDREAETREGLAADMAAETKAIMVDTVEEVAEIMEAAMNTEEMKAIMAATRGVMKMMIGHLVNEEEIIDPEIHLVVADHQMMIGRPTEIPEEDRLEEVRVPQPEADRLPPDEATVPVTIRIRGKVVPVEAGMVEEAKGKNPGSIVTSDF